MTVQKRNDNYYILKTLSLAILILSFSIGVFGQLKVSEKVSRTVVSDSMMRQVVKDFLIRYFKPTNRKKVVYLFQYFKSRENFADSNSKTRLEKSWLPRIKGIEFEFLSSQESENLQHYFFTDLEKLPTGHYEIGFAYGCYPSCGYDGKIWDFRILKKDVIVWEKTRKGLGSSGEDYGVGVDADPPPVMKKQN